MFSSDDDHFDDKNKDYNRDIMITHNDDAWRSTTSTQFPWCARSTEVLSAMLPSLTSKEMWVCPKFIESEKNFVRRNVDPNWVQIWSKIRTLMTFPLRQGKSWQSCRRYNTPLNISWPWSCFTILLKDEVQWWTVENYLGQQGLAPVPYLKPAQPKKQHHHHHHHQKKGHHTHNQKHFNHQKNSKTQKPNNLRHSSLKPNSTEKLTP